MSDATSIFRRTELDRTNFPALYEQIAQAESEGVAVEIRTYPGYPCWKLKATRKRRGDSLDQALASRRSIRALGCGSPSRHVLSRILQSSHGITGEHYRGPVPSAGGLQALELYLVHFDNAWLPPGLYHYDRAGHHLSQIVDRADRADWLLKVPVLEGIEGGTLLWVLVGDTLRVTSKYGERGYRLLLLEAGHLMQNLCLTSASVGLSTVPLGGYFEREIALEFQLPSTDAVLYTAIAGEV